MRSRLLVVSVATAILAACAGSASPGGDDVLGDDALTVGSFNFPESVLLAELYSQAVEARGIRVIREFDIGPRELVEPALQRGLIELVPEYAGSLLEFVAGGRATANLVEVRADLRVALEARGIVPFASAPAQNRNGFAVTADLSRSRRIVALSDLAGIQDLTLGGPPECQRRPLCLPGLEERYGLSFASFFPLDQSGPLTAEALVRGVVDVGLMFTTSPEIVRRGLVLLEDDRRLQPAEHVTPVVHRRAAERFGPALGEALDAVSTWLTTDELRSMNVLVEVTGADPAEVAHGWLAERGLLSPGG